MSKQNNKQNKPDQVDENEIEQEDVADEVESDEDENESEENQDDSQDDVVKAVEPDTAKKAVEKPDTKQKKGTVLLRFKADRTYNVGEVYDGKEAKEFREMGLIV